ncbi:MAG: SDR family NAD(P)-dependent oxidoreductase [Novosphingobium sp.]|nr:SDR family NAD(P)-dependent oxidoreductase [Novosphingobium sp.]
MAGSEIRFDNQAVVVTGAGRGLGKAQAVLLAARGAKVVVADNGSAMDGGDASAGPAEQVAAEIREAGGEAVPASGDLSTLEGANGAIQDCVDAYGRIDGLAHYASTCPDLKGPEEMEDRDIELLLAVNPLAGMRMARAAWPHMQSQGFGRLLFCPSAAVYGARGNAPYAAAKAAHIGVVRCLALEGADHNIRVNGILPGANTRMTEAFLPSSYGQWFFKQMPPERVAVAGAFLLSDASDINGEFFAVGGGRIARVTFAEADGVFDAGESIEAVQEAMPNVMADKRWSYPDDLTERTLKVNALFGQ